MAQGEHLHAQLAGPVRPSKSAEDDDDVSQPRAVQVRGNDDDERKDRDDEQDVGDERKPAVRDAAEIGRRDADDYSYEGRQTPRGEGDDEGLPCPPYELRVDVLTLRSRAKPVRSRWRKGWREIDRRRVVRRDLTREDG